MVNKYIALAFCSVLISWCLAVALWELLRALRWLRHIVFVVLVVGFCLLVR